MITKQYPFITLIFLLALCYLLGSLLAYPVYHLSGQAATDFHKIARHCTLFCGLILTFLVSRLYYSDDSPVNTSDRSSHWVRSLAYGLTLGLLVFFVIESLLLLLSVRELRSELAISWSFLLITIAKGLVTGLLVALVEELLFRKYLYNILAGQQQIFNVIVQSSILYAAVHFMDFPVFQDSTRMNWLSGVQLLPQTFAGLLSLNIWDTFLTLFFLGCLLAIFRARYHTIYYCIGIHAGVVMGVKLSRKLTEYNPETTLGFLVNSTDRQQGLLASLVLLVVCGLCYWWLFIRQQAHHERFP